LKIIEIEGIGKKYASKLGRAGYTEIEDLSKLTWEQINELAVKTKIPSKRIDKWQEQADLISLKSIGPEYAEALNKVGIDSVKELSHRNAKNTLEKIKSFDKRRPNVIRKLPTLKQIESWIAMAKDVYEDKKLKKTPKMDLIDIEGIGVKYARILGRVGLKTVEDLLPLTNKNKKEISTKTKISAKMIDKWQEHADLMRIIGIGPEYSDALNQTGVDSVKELAKRTPQSTLDKLIEFDKKKPDVIRKIPELVDIKDWIAQAKKIK